jgi:hypothetical protein
MMRGDEGPRGHGTGDVGTGIGVGIGVGIGTGIMREILTNPQVQQNPVGQTPGGAVKNNDRRTKKAARSGAGQEAPKKGQGNPQDKKPSAPQPTPTDTTTTNETDKDRIPTKRHLSIISVTNNGTEQAKTEIDCNGHTGTISVSTDLDIEWPRLADNRMQYRKNEISIGYRGTNCDDCMWVQFLWSEAKVTDKDGKVIAIGDITLQTPAGPMQVTDDPTHRKYSVDSGPDSPAFEAIAPSNVDANSNVIFDRTTSPLDIDSDDPFSKYKQDRRTAKIEWIDHFETFLVCRGVFCAKVTWNDSYTWELGAQNPDASTVPHYFGIKITTNEKPDAGELAVYTNKLAQAAGNQAKSAVQNVWRALQRW